MTSLNTYEIASMRQDLTNTQLSMRCTIERGEATGYNPDGHPVETWSVLHENLPCWYWEQILRSLLEETLGPQVDIIESVPEMLLPARTDVTTRDRISVVQQWEPNEGWVTLATNLNIKTALHRLLDVHLICEAQT